MNRLLAGAALAVLSAVSAPAFAGEANGEPFPYSAPGSTYQYVGAPLAVATGSEALPQFAATAAMPSGGAGLFAGGGSDSDLGSANSRPRGFGDGTAEYAQAQSVQHYLQAQLERAPRRNPQDQARTLASQVRAPDRG